MTTRIEEQKAKKAAYDCEYRSNNREKKNEWSRAWRKANQEKIRASAHARYKANPERERNRTRAWAEANPEKVRGNYLFKRYGLTIEQWNALLAGQDGACAICHTTKPGGNGKWHTDHDRNTGVVRGLLCFDCNTGIGKLKHDLSLLRRAIDYLGKELQGNQTWQ